MTVNEMVFSLLREALFGEKNEIVDYPSDRIFWMQVYTELHSQAVLGLASNVVPNHREIPEEILEKWNDYQRFSVIRYVRMYAEQTEAVRLLQEADIPVVVMKGMASACYYPIPEYRTMGDVDLLVAPDKYTEAIEVLKNNQFFVEGEERGRYHTAFMKNGYIFELHQSPASVHKDVHGEAIREYILSGLNAIEINQLGPDLFPVLPWKQNGMELIWHIRQHLYNGLGLRHIIDWMMFVNYILDDVHYEEFSDALKTCGLDQLAIHVTRLCQRYLGLREDGITWCRTADEKVCDDLLDFIMEQGNFGEKKGLDDKTAKVLSGYNGPLKFIRKLQETGKFEWKTAKKYPILLPFAWLYAGGVGIRRIVSQEGGIQKFRQDVLLGRKRVKMFEKLYSTGHKNNLRELLDKINRSRVSKLFMVAAEVGGKIQYPVYEMICALKGYRMPNKEERELVRENVTFIYKSFQRQKKARELYYNIQKFYPGARVIIADDSRTPLIIKEKYATVINLPFNSGLSYGLNRAIEKVKTPYVMRLDDDHLITRKTKVGEQLSFLKNHSEIDLVHFVFLNALRIENLETYLKKYYRQTMSHAPKQLIIPHMTRIDETHRVLAKGPNVFLVKTKALRRIGYDDNIRMLDHDEFFYRAAGNIVGVIAEDTKIFHRNNPFNTSYLKYRQNIEEDVQYIIRRQQVGTNKQR